MLVALAREHFLQLRRAHYTRRVPIAVVDPPEVFRTTLRVPAVREGDAINLSQTLRINARHDRGRAIDRRQRVANMQRTHFSPTRWRLDLRIQWLTFAHRRATGDDDQVSVLQPGRHFVEVDESGRFAGDRRGVAMQFVEPRHDVREQTAHLPDYF